MAETLPLPKRQSPGLGGWDEKLREWLSEMVLWYCCALKVLLAGRNTEAVPKPILVSPSPAAIVPPTNPLNSYHPPDQSIKTSRHSPVGRSTHRVCRRVTECSVCVVVLLTPTACSRADATISEFTLALDELDKADRDHCMLACNIEAG